MKNALAEVPIVTSVVPSEGYSDKETSITISGENFADGAKVSLLSNPGFISSCIENLSIFNVFVDGNYAYTTDRKGLRILDITDKGHPTEVGFYDTPGKASGLHVLGDYAYVAENTFGSPNANNSGGLRILDITDKMHPKEVSFYNISNQINEVHVSGGFAYLAENDPNGGIRIIDINDKKNPFKVGFYDTPHCPLDVYVSGNYAYVVDGTSGPIYADPNGDLIDPNGSIRIIDITNKNNPLEVGFYDIPTVASKVYISGDYAYIPSITEGLKIIDISDKTNPLDIGFYADYFIFDIYVSGNYAYVANFEGLKIINITDKTNPLEVGCYDLSGIVSDVHVLGDYVYVAFDEVFEDECLLIIDIHDKTNPLKAGLYSCFSGEALDVHILGDYAYVANGSAGLKIIDIVDKEHPLEIGFSDTPGQALNVYVLGNYAYVADGDEGLRIIDISNKKNPSEIGFYDTVCSGNWPFLPVCGSLYANDVYVQGDYAYVTSLGIYSGGMGLNTGNFHIIDISTPSNPSRVGSYKTTDDAERVYVLGNYAYVTDNTFGSTDADPNRGLRIIDIADKENPVEVGFYNTPGHPLSVYVLGDYAYLSDRDIGPSNANTGLRIIDISNKVHPFVVGFYDTPEHVYNIYISGDYVYTADHKGGLSIIKCIHSQCINVSIPGPQIITATVPTGFSKGIYNVVVTNPDNEYAVLRNAFTVYQNYCKDTDKDGYGDAESCIQAISTPNGYVSNNTDCDDNDPNINPSVIEICDDKDNNCNGKIDDGLSVYTYYSDADGDGYGDPNNLIEKCYQPIGYLIDNTDCNDNDPNIHPNGLDICDGKDNDCDGIIDDPNKLPFDYYYLDSDGDGYGDPHKSQYACKRPPEYVTNAEDCDDTDKDVYLDAIEICDGKDNNCDGKVDVEGSQGCTIYYKDEDNDGQGVDIDSRCLCSPNDPNKYTAIYSGDLEDLDPNIQGTILTGNMNLPKGWSMISVPLDPDNASFSSLFPDAVVIYGYEKGKGYVRVKEGENLETGRGYWILLNEAKTYSISGEIIDKYNFSVQDEWYMIGGCSSDAQASVDNGSIIVIYGYEQGSGYIRIQEGEHLKPGKGYWILFKDVVDQCELTVEVIDPNI